MQRSMKQCRQFLILMLLGASLFAPPQLTLAMQGGESPDKIWLMLDKRDVRLEGTEISTLKNRLQLPENVRFVRLEPARLRRALDRRTGRVSTASRTDGFLEITLPLPDGTFARFAVEEAPLAEQRPGDAPDPVKSYRGQGIDDPTMTVRLNQAPDGVHAIVLAPGRTSYIDPFPLRRGDPLTHVTFFRKEFGADLEKFRCLVSEDAEGPALLRSRAERPSSLVNGETLRTYRVAIATTGEYTQFHGGAETNPDSTKIERARQAILHTLARVNGIYERELAITMVLVPDNRKIIFVDPAKDPYTNSNSSRMMGENQLTLDKEIGAANYDIGHVFGVGSGGIARIRSVSQNGIKAMGVTGRQRPVGDPFDVDYVAHEMGHQFGANHTFNATTGSCGDGNRNPTTAYEPGSGSTIMAYAGICGPQQDLQKNSDDSFHIASLEEIIAHVTTAGGGTARPSNNRPPAVSGNDATFIVPKGTPFVLTASGSDPDGDVLTYSWEEYDLGESNPPDDDVLALRPLFRAFSPSRIESRFFPQMARVLDGGGPILGEALPSRSRTMTFRVTARDNRAGGGGIGDAAASLSVITDAGPFVVTQPTRAAVWTVGSTQTVIWDVAGTSAAPLNTAQVRISLSTDGGKTFSVLLPSTPNTGSTTITVPNAPATAARVKVEAIGNVYFNVSPGDFRIVN